MLHQHLDLPMHLPQDDLHAATVQQNTCYSQTHAQGQDSAAAAAASLPLLYLMHYKPLGKYCGKYAMQLRAEFWTRTSCCG
jgi:hypothetical protein